MNKRRAIRFLARLHVRLNHESITSWGILSDVSEKGIFIRSNRDFVTGKEIRIEIVMPDSTTSILRGIVRRKRELQGSHRKYGLGVEITERDQSYLKFIDYLKSAAEEQDGLAGGTILRV